jgi:hypothetical protein
MKIISTTKRKTGVISISFIDEGMEYCLLLTATEIVEIWKAAQSEQVGDVSHRAPCGICSTDYDPVYFCKHHPA